MANTQRRLLFTAKCYSSQLVRSYYFECREQIKKAWIADMERLRVSIPFFLWFPTYTFKFGLPDVYSKPSLNVQTALMKVWHFTKGGSVSAIHPPLEDLTFLLKDVALTAIPFRKGREGDTAATCADVNWSIYSSLQ